MASAWWDAVSGTELEQGQLFGELYHPLMSLKQFTALKEPGLQASVKFQKLSGIVVTQSCDLLQGKLKRVVVCKALSVPEMRKNGFDNDTLEEVRLNRRPSFVMLSGPDDDTDREASIVVDLRLTISLPVEYMTEAAKSQSPRPALKSPYVEYLSSAFGRYFSRVALPNDVPSFVTGSPAA